MANIGKSPVPSFHSKKGMERIISFLGKLEGAIVNGEPLRVRCFRFLKFEGI